MGFGLVRCFLTALWLSKARLVAEYCAAFSAQVNGKPRATNRKSFCKEFMSVGKTKGVRILGIESSCDETAAAVVVDGCRILSSVVASQIDIHRKYGGVVPELASREHLRQIVPVVREALADAGLRFDEVDAIGVTQGPGLVGSLLVGITYGKTLAEALGKPLLAVNHLEGHVHAALLQARQDGGTPELPAVSLIVSGGHTVLYEVRATSENGSPTLRYRKLGQTRDDAAGEAYDKVAKLLGLGYPGGPVLDRLAAAADALPAPVKFGPTRTRGNALDFSFSGLKTAVLYHLREHPEYDGEIREREEALAQGRRKFDELLSLCSPATLGLVREFQNAVVRDLVERTLAAAEETGVGNILVSGGVAANSQLRATLLGRTRERGLKIYLPSRELSTDNAAMIAAAAYARYLGGVFADSSLNAVANMPLA